MKLVLRVDRRYNGVRDVLTLEEHPKLGMHALVELLARFAWADDDTGTGSLRRMEHDEAVAALSDVATLAELDALVDGLYGRVREAEAAAVPPPSGTP